MPLTAPIAIALSARLSCAVVDGATPWLTLKHDRSIRARLAAIVEPFSIILAATLAARFLLDSLGIADADEFLFRDGAPPDFLAAARSEGARHALRYGLVILLVAAIGWWRGRRRLISYGVSLGGGNLPRLIGTGWFSGWCSGCHCNCCRSFMNLYRLARTRRFGR